VNKIIVVPRRLKHCREGFAKSATISSFTMLRHSTTDVFSGFWLKNVTNSETKQPKQSPIQPAEG